MLLQLLLLLLLLLPAPCILPLLPLPLPLLPAPCILPLLPASVRCFLEAELHWCQDARRMCGEAASCSSGRQAGKHGRTASQLLLLALAPLAPLAPLALRAKGVLLLAPLASRAKCVHGNRICAGSCDLAACFAAARVLLLLLLASPQ